MSIVKLNNRGVKNATAIGSITGLGSMTLIKKLTASSSATLSFVHGSSGVTLDNSYKEYLFTFNNLHPATNDKTLQFNMSVDSGSNYNVTKTTTFFHAYNAEDGSEGALQYDANMDLAQSTNFQNISQGASNGSDMGVSGTLQLFDPSSATFVKHYISRMSHEIHNYSRDVYSAGYGNTTSAVDAIQFKFSSGNIDAGDICLYGIA